MSSHTVRDRRAKVRAYMAEHGVNYTTAARALGLSVETPAPATPAGPPPAEERFGGHEFEYEQSTDLFRCSECREYEVVAQQDDGSFTPCPGLAGWDGDPERVYLLATENPAVNSGYRYLGIHARKLGIGRSTRYGYRDGRLLIETAPAVVDKLHRALAKVTAPTNGAGGEHKPAAASIERLTAEQGQAVIAENYRLYVEEYGEPDAPPKTATIVVHTLTLPESTSDSESTSDYDEYDDEDYGDSSGYFDDNPELDYHYD